MKIHLPSSIDALRVKHMRTIQKAAKDNDNTYSVAVRLRMVSEFTGITVDELRDYSVRDVGKVFNHILTLYNQYQKKAPPKQITLKGQKYNLVKDVGKTMPSGWFIDIDGFKDQFDERPELLAAFSYIEDGRKYAQTNDNGAIINPLVERADIMRDHLPLPIYLDLSAFFLEKFNKLELGYLSVQAARLRAANDQVKRMIGSKS